MRQLHTYKYLEPKPVRNLSRKWNGTVVSTRSMDRYKWPLNVFFSISKRLLCCPFFLFLGKKISIFKSICQKVLYNSPFQEAQFWIKQCERFHPIKDQDVFQCPFKKFPIIQSSRNVKHKLEAQLLLSTDSKCVIKDS